MDLNRETAMRLWTKSFGKETKVKDYTGRTIAKGAYNDRNSEFGWNLDHILPQSRGGKTADYNLVCCHILTNDEKADKFPGFKANGIAFEIVKVENHYEIHRVGNSGKKKPKAEADYKVNFMDSASGVRFFAHLSEIQQEEAFTGTVFVRLSNLQTTALIDFIDEIFRTENVSLSQMYLTQMLGYSNETEIVIRKYDMPYQSDIQEILDKCVTLNTYLKCYFLKVGCISGYKIYYRVDPFDNKKEMYLRTRDIRVDYQNGWENIYLSSSQRDGLFIDSLVICNTNAKKTVSTEQFQKYTRYDKTCPRLEKNLEKEVNGR